VGRADGRRALRGGRCGAVGVKSPTLRRCAQDHKCTDSWGAGLAQVLTKEGGFSAIFRGLQAEVHRAAGPSLAPRPLGEPRAVAAETLFPRERACTVGTRVGATVGGGGGGLWGRVRVPRAGGAAL
jgi:hypothetical protein